MADGGMLDPPACLDVCALYGRSNPALVAGLLRSLGELDGGAAGVHLAQGLEESGATAARALAEVHAKVSENRDAGRLGSFLPTLVGWLWERYLLVLDGCCGRRPGRELCVGVLPPVSCFFSSFLCADGLESRAASRGHCSSQEQGCFFLVP